MVRVSSKSWRNQSYLGSSAAHLHYVLHDPVEMSVPPPAVLTSDSRGYNHTVSIWQEMNTAHHMCCAYLHLSACQLTCCPQPNQQWSRESSTPHTPTQRMRERELLDVVEVYPHLSCPPPLIIGSSLTRGLRRTYSAPTPFGPYNLWPLMDMRSTVMAFTFTGIFPTAWRGGEEMITCTY